jgi:hypothetical protein
MAREGTRPTCKVAIVAYVTSSCLVWHLAASSGALSTCVPMPTDASIRTISSGDENHIDARLRYRQGPFLMGYRRNKESKNSECVAHNECCEQRENTAALFGRLGPVASNHFPFTRMPKGCGPMSLRPYADAAGMPDGSITISGTVLHRSPVQGYCGEQSATHAKVQLAERLRGGADDAFFEGYNALKPNDWGQNSHIFQVNHFAMLEIRTGVHFLHFRSSHLTHRDPQARQL